MTNEEIKKHINERLEALKLELESNFIRVTKESDFEDGVWYSNGNGYDYGLFSKMGSFNKGFVNEIWYDNIGMVYVPQWKKVTDFTELGVLLKKEAVKRGMVEGACINQSVINNKWTAKPILGSNYFEFKPWVNILYCDSIAVFYKGKWAEVVKEKTTEEWLNQLDAHLSDICGDNNTYLDIFIKFFEQNNLEITQKK